LGLGYAKADRGPEAIAALQKAVHLDPVHVRAWENLGISLCFANRTDEALAALKRATDLGAAEPDVWNDYGVILMQKGRFDESNAALNKGFKLAPNSRKLWNSEGLLKEKQGDLPGAVEAFNQALKIDPGYSVGWCNLGLAQSAMKNDDAAIASYEKAVQLDPKLGAGWANISIACGNKHEWNEAYTTAQQAILYKPNDAGGWFCLGHAAFGLHKKEEAVVDFQKAFDVLDPGTFAAQGNAVYGDLLCEYGLAAVTIGHLDDGEKILDKAIALAPNGPRVLAAIGELRLQQKRWEESRDASQRSLDLDPHVPRTWANLGAALFGLNRPPAEALQAFQKATALQPDFDFAWFETGEADELLHQPADAVEAYRKAVACNPGMLEAWRRLTVTTPDPAESDKAAAQAIALAPRDVATYLLLAALQATRKNWAEAEKDDRKALEIDPANSLAWARLGQVLASEKNLPDAIAAEEQAVQHATNAPPTVQAQYWNQLAIVHVNAGGEKGQPEWQAGLDAANHALTLDPATSLYWYVAAVCQKQLGHLDEAKADAVKFQQLGGAMPNATHPTATASPPSTTNASATPPPAPAATNAPAP